MAAGSVRNTWVSSTDIREQVYSWPLCPQRRLEPGAARGFQSRWVVYHVSAGPKRPLLLLLELSITLWWNLMPPFNSGSFSAASQPAAFITTAFHVTTRHLLPTFLYILWKTSVPPPPLQPPFFFSYLLHIPSVPILPFAPISGANGFQWNLHWWLHSHFFFFQRVGSYRHI